MVNVKSSLVQITREVAAAIVRSGYVPKIFYGIEDKDGKPAAMISVEDVAEIAAYGEAILKDDLRIEGTMQKEG